MGREPGPWYTIIVDLMRGDPQVPSPGQGHAWLRLREAAEYEKIEPGLHDEVSDPGLTHNPRMQTMGNPAPALKSLTAFLPTSPALREPVDIPHQAEIIPFPEAARPPLVSIVVPVYREEVGINQFLHQLLATPRVDQCEVILVDGHPEATTLKAVSREFTSRVLVLQSRQGRGTQMNAGAAKARSEILLFLHADTLLPPNGISNLVQVASPAQGSTKATCGFGAFGLSIRSLDPWLRLVAWTTTWRARHTRIPYGDQAMFIRKELFREVGGFRELPLLEDVDFVMRLRKKGTRPQMLSERVITSPRRWEDNGAFLTTMRHRLIMSLYWSKLPPRFIAKLVRR